jgi:hypothetical protein
MGKRSMPDSPLNVDGRGQYGWMTGRECQTVSRALQSASRRPFACSDLYHELLLPEEDPASDLKPLYHRLVALAASWTVVKPSLSPWLQLGSQYEAAQSTRPKLTRRPEEPTLTEPSEPRRVRKPLSIATRSSILAYANAHPSATHEAIAGS